MDFEGLKDKAEQLADEHSDQLEQGIDKAADAAGERFGHDDQIDKAADALKDRIPGND